MVKNRFGFKGSQVKVTFKFPIALLSIMLRRADGRNNKGVITVRSKGGGYSQRFRLIAFRGFIKGVGVVCRYEFDFYRKKPVLLVCLRNGFLFYKLAVEMVGVGNFLHIGFFKPFFCGDYLVLSFLYQGAFINSCEFFPNRGFFARSAGSLAVLLKKWACYALIRLPSKEERLISLASSCTVGRLVGENFKFLTYSKAGAIRCLGKRPVVRGVAKNPVDHPHGGGEGRTSGGQPSVTPWGLYTKGIRTSTRLPRLVSHFLFKRR